MADNKGRMAFDEDGNEIEDEEEGTEKSLPSEDDLIKAMDILEDTARSVEGGVSMRQQDLAQRMAAGEDLTKSERDELARHIAGDLDDDFEKSTRESWAEDPAIAEGWEVSGYLDARDTALAKSLDAIKDALTSSNVENAAVIGRLAKGLHAIGMSNLALRRKVDSLEKSLGGTQAIAARQPQRPAGRTSRVGQRFGEQPLNKSEGAGGPGIPQDPDAQKEWLNKSLTELIKSTEPGGKNAEHGFGVLHGVDLVFEQAKLENYSEVSPQAMKLIAEHRGINL
jgi:hypothetical protein